MGVKKFQVLLMGLLLVFGISTTAMGQIRFDTTAFTNTLLTALTHVHVEITAAASPATVTAALHGDGTIIGSPPKSLISLESFSRDLERLSMFVVITADGDAMWGPSSSTQCGSILLNL